jgi:hypothetical protein
MRRLAPLAALALALLAVPASADECKGDATTCGREAFDAGVSAFQKKDWPAALEAFRRAYAIRQHPIVTYNLALAEEKSGFYASATSHYDAVATDPKAESKLRDDAKQGSQRTRPKLTIVVADVPGGGSVAIEVDGQRSEGREVRIDPGEHRLRIIADDQVVLERSAKTESGERLVLTVGKAAPTPTGSNEPPPEPLTRPAPAPHDRAPERGNGLSPTWFYVGAGATVVLGGVAAWSGIDTLKSKSDFDRDLASLPRDQQQSRLDDGHARERRTNVLIAATAVVGVGTGVLGLFLVDWGKTKTTVGVSGTSAFVRGRF